MSWEKVRLGDVTDSCLGKMLDQEKNKGDYHPYLANVNVRWGSFDLENLPQMRFEDDEQERYGLKYGDLIICEGGEPGRCAIWKDAIPNLKIQKALHRVRVHDCLDYRYLFYWFLWAGKRGALEQYFTGATIKHMPSQKLKSVIIDKPPIETQRRIADILSAYDDLIENNRKQIKLLEEAAQRLYKEWFVDLHFPGHEHTKIVDDVPEGWGRGTLDNIVDETGKNTKKENRQEYAYYLPIDCLPKKSIGYVDTNDIKLAESSLVSFDKGDIIFGAMRPYFHKVVVARDKGLTRSTCFILNSRVENMWGYVTMLLFDNATIEYATQISIGTTMPYVRWKDMKLMPVLIPNKQIATSFNSLVKPIINRVGLLAHHISDLGQARDRLLPKLMSGEVEVSK